MDRISELFDRAVQLLQAGHLTEAEEIGKRIVSAKPELADAWHLLGVLALRMSKNERAVVCLNRAIAINPNDAEVQNNLGVALKNQNLLVEAIICFRQAITLQPGFAAGYYNLANALHEQGQIEAAIAGYRRALELTPGDAAIHNGLANALREKGKVVEAIAGYRRAIELQPAYAEAHYNLANVYQQQGRDEEAIPCYRRALELNPNYAEAHSNLGAILKDQDRLDEAAACFSRALELKPQDVELHYNWAGILLAQNKLADATAQLDHVLGMQPDHAEAHLNRSGLSLLAGDFERGWPEYEWRWNSNQIRERELAASKWAGEPLAGRTILLHAEQGFGDTFQFVRYVSLVKNLGATVVFECQKPLVNLLSKFPGIDLLIPEGQELPAFDYHVPLLSLPGIFKTTLATIPATVPYLFADPALVDYWHDKLADVPGFRIGINWHGRVDDELAARRDIPLQHFLALAKPGVRLISLQKSPQPNELSDPHHQLPIVDFGSDFDLARGAFVDTAAIMMNLDLVISSDTSVVHLAGALGVPIWVAIPSIPDWRWLLDRSDCPWYPTMRLFRQKSPGDWSSVFDEIIHALATRLQT